MKKGFILVAMVMAVFAFACAPKATLDEATKACEKEQALKTQGQPIEDPAAKVMMEFQKKMQDLNQAKAAALAAIDESFAEKLGKAKKEADKKKINDEIAKQKEAKEQELAPQFADLNKQREEALKKAAEEKKRIEDEKKKAIADCANGAIKAGVTKAKAQCQAKAAKMDEYGKCK